MRISEKSIEEVHSLSPIEEESECTPFLREVPDNFPISELEGNACDNVTRHPYKERRRRMLRKMEGNREVY